MVSLVLTLGHNSSAILVSEGKIINGYEEERFTGVKSESRFPINAINKLCVNDLVLYLDGIYVSHWDTFAKLEGMSAKHWNPSYLKILFPDTPVYSLSEEFSHHDAHAEVARVFAETPYEWEIVSDGFGTFNETFSVYNKGELVHRCFGFDKSIGLFYQYATASIGLKMNQDEYKLLGFESHIAEVLNNKAISRLQELAEKYSKKLANKILKPQLVPEYDLVAGLEALPNYRLKVHNYLLHIINERLGIKNKSLTDFERRVIISFYVQTIVELTFRRIIHHFGMKEVLLSGGVFMNVKLNNSIAKVMDRICVLPICGDQSAGLGVYQHFNKDLKWPGHLFWGKRKLPKEEASGIWYVDNIYDAKDLVGNLVKGGFIVNLVYGDMEFGARALGHTSTLAKPTEANVRYINHLNDRETTMPMAGMVTSFDKYHDASKIDLSTMYMIMTLDRKEAPNDDCIGVHHKYPLTNVWSNRVQMIPKNHELRDLVERFPHGLINTSANYHGQTIPLLPEQVIAMHEFQLKRDHMHRMRTIVVRN